MMFLIKYSKFVAPLIAVICLAGAFWYHGDVQYRKGVTDTQQANLVEQIKSDRQNIKDVAKNEQKYKSMPISDIDIIGFNRGWMRAEQDR